MTSPRNAVITGAARGIGHAIAVRLASDGCNVVVNDLLANQTSLNTLVAEIEASGWKAVSFAGDMSVEQCVNDLVEKCVTSYGSLDIGLFDTNFRSVWLGYQCAAKQMIKQGKGGRIIGYPLMSVYSATKFAVRGLTQAAVSNIHPVVMKLTPFCAVEDLRKESGRPRISLGLCLFLASEESGFITGQSILVDGGVLFD
ncbi:acetoin reductase family protein [Mycena vulgaris]|nr:acetoin reductase family protein [Mycena vulgaris]